MNVLRYLNINRLKPLLDFISFSLDCGVSFVTEDNRGIIYETENGTCESYLECEKVLEESCFNKVVSDAAENGITMYVCEKNMHVIPFPIKTQEKTAGWIILGPLLLSEENDNPTDRKSKIPVISREKIDKAVKMISPVIDVITELINDKIALQKKNSEIEKSFEKQKITEQELEKALEELETIFDNSQVGIMLLHGGRYLAKGNQRLAEILGWKNPEEMTGISMRELHTSDKTFREYGEKYFNPLAHGERIHVEYQLARKSGEPVWCILSGKALDKNDPADLSKGVIWIIDEISKRKKLEEELRKLASTDFLTSLTNRAGFEKSFNNELLRAERYDSFFTLLLIDLDNFKDVNDTYGHDAGDAVLKHFSSILKKVLREIDIISRVGGEEFAVILPDTLAGSGKKASGRILSELRKETLIYNGQKIVYSASIGVSGFEKGSTLREIYSRADKALYRAKAAGKDRVCS